MTGRSKIIRQACAALLAALLACAPPLSLAQQKNQAAAKAKSLSAEQKIIHLLDRATFGARPGDFERVRQMGWEKFLAEQLHPARLADQAVEEKLKRIESIHLNNAELAKYYPPAQVLREALKARGLEPPNQIGQLQLPANEKTAASPKDGQPSNADEISKRREAMKALAELGYKPAQLAVSELQQAKILRAVYSERQLQEVMTDFWFNHFNVFIQKGADRVLTTSYERDAIRPHVFGKFENLLRATAESPAMLWYLDNWMSAAPDAKNLRDRMKEARQLRRANADRPGRAGKLNRRNQMPDQMPEMQQAPQAARLGKRARGLNENYAREIMELHTLGVDGGYTQKDVQEVARCFTGWTLRNPRGGAEFYFNPMMHDDGEKLVLGKKIPAGGGKKDGETVIHLLAMHPATAKFIATKLARKFVNDTPPQSLVTKMAQTFQKTEGDISEVLRTLFKSPEFWAAENYRAKIKTPFEMTVSAARALGAETNGGPQFHRWLLTMGEGLFLMQPPTGYPDTAEHWVNTGALLERMNFALALSANRINGTRVDLAKLAPASSATAQTVDYYLNLLLRGEASAQTRATIDQALKDQQVARADGSVDAAKIVGLILGSPEFQRQ